MADEKSESSVVAATNRIRETAKWATVSLAALGSVLIAGSQLSDLGALDQSSNRFWAAAIGGLAAVVGILLVLGMTVRTMATPLVSIGGLAAGTPSAAKKWLEKPENAAALRGRTLVDLSTNYLGAVHKRNAAYSAYVEAEANDRQQKGHDYQLAEAGMLDLDRDVTNVLQIAQFQAVAHRWYVCFGTSILGALLAAGGIGLFAWASNPPEDAAASAASPNVVAAPTKAMLQLSSAGKDALSAPLKCDKAALGVLLLAKTAAGPDVVVQEPGCAEIRVIIGASWGTVA